VETIPALAEVLLDQLDLVRRITRAQLSVASPCPGWTVRHVINHSIGVTQKFTRFAEGDDRPSAPTGDLIGDDHVQAIECVVELAHSAWSSVDTTRHCELSFGSFSADLAAGINLFDVLAHGWDVATALGLDWDPAEDLWMCGLDAATAVIGEQRDSVHFANEMPIPLEASNRERLLAFLGRGG
jgi:uncharacterized protein (TIGR03086 family)